MTARSIAVVILRADLFFLASDPMRGRLTDTDQVRPRNSESGIRNLE